MTIRTYASYPRTAVEAIPAGYLCGIASGQVDLLDDSGQTTVVTVAPLGVASTTTSADGDEIAVVNFGEAMVIAGTGGLSADQFFVAEAGTGKALPYAEATYTDGQTVYLCGRALEDIAANAIGRAWVQIQQISVSNP